MATIAEASRFRAIGYWDDGAEGAIYVVDYYDNNAQGKGIYEINASTGAYTRLGTHVGSGAYQVLRYNNELLVVGLDDMLTVYDFNGGVLGASTAYDLGLGDLYGLGVAGNGADVTGFWATSTGGTVSYFAMPDLVVIPEPITMVAVGLAVAGLGGYIRRRKMA